MPQLTRFGVSMDAELLSAFDAFVLRQGFENRSEALRQLAVEALVEPVSLPERTHNVVIVHLLTHGSDTVRAELSATLRTRLEPWTLSQLTIPLDSGNQLDVCVVAQSLEIVNTHLRSLDQSSGVLSVRAIAVDGEDQAS